jgi:site-specific DNA-methyltransferase (adenine-specific)
MKHPYTKPLPEHNKVYNGDCYEWLSAFPDNTFTAVVTDPPYGLSNQPDMQEVLKNWMAGSDYEHRGAGFMGKTWDSFVPGPKIWEEVYRVLKPGGHVLSFSGTRTYDLMVTAMRLASFQVRDKMDYYLDITGYKSWVYGSGFPKSLDISKAIDKAAGAEREVTGSRVADNIKGGNMHASNRGERHVIELRDSPATDAAKQWDGWGTALKPAHEPVAQVSKANEDGAMPPNPDAPPFLYQAKTAKKERNYGCKWVYWVVTDRPHLIDKDEYEGLKAENEAHKGEDGYEPHKLQKGNIHPTVKPLSLCRYLVNLVKMPGDNLILDPFCGSGSVLCAAVLEGCDFVGIDQDPMSVELSEARTHYFRCLGKMGLD